MAVMLNLGIEEGLLAGPQELNVASEDVAQTRRGRLYLRGLKIQSTSEVLALHSKTPELWVQPGLLQANPCTTLANLGFMFFRTINRLPDVIIAGKIRLAISFPELVFQPARHP